MKKLLVCLLVSFIAASCGNTVVKKEKIYQYKAVMAFGEITPDISSLMYLEVREYDKNGYVIKSTTYDEYGKENYIRNISYDSYTNEGIKTLNYAYMYDGQFDTLEVYYNQDIKEWVYLVNGKVDNTIPKTPLNIEDYKDDVIGTDVRGENEASTTYNLNYYYNGAYTKVDDKGNWIEGYFEATNDITGEKDYAIYVREILEYWD